MSQTATKAAASAFASIGPWLNEFDLDKFLEANQGLIQRLAKICREGDLQETQKIISEVEVCLGIMQKIVQSGDVTSPSGIIYFDLSDEQRKKVRNDLETMSSLGIDLRDHFIDKQYKHTAETGKMPTNNDPFIWVIAQLGGIFRSQAGHFLGCMDAYDMLSSAITHARKPIPRLQDCSPAA